jgi:hypothetical protein
MEVGDWITLSAVIVALGIGVASILHTQSLQRKERRERFLNEIIEWSEAVHKAIWMAKKETIESDIESISDNILFLLGQSVVIMEIARKVDLDLGVEVLMAAQSISGFLKHLHRMDTPEAIKEHFKLAKSLEEVLSNPEQSEELRVKLNDERMELLRELWTHLTNIKVKVSDLKGL